MFEFFGMFQNTDLNGQQKFATSCTITSKKNIFKA